MKLLLQCILGWVILVLITTPVYAERDIAKEVAKNCNVELERFCRDVSPGKGRILACLYAYSDKASNQCRDSVRDAYDDLKLISAVTSHLKNECRDDLDRFCRKVAPGEGRLLNCLDKNHDKLSEKCKLALKETGVKD